MISQQRRDHQGKHGDPGRGKKRERAIGSKARADDRVKLITLYANFKKLMKIKEKIANFKKRFTRFKRKLRTHAIVSQAAKLRKKSKVLKNRLNF